MASYHCAVKVGGKGRAGKHADYIEREGDYQKANGLEDLEHKSSGNMPAWAEYESGKFWYAADEHERANGATYREIEVALPRELSKSQRIELVEQFIREEIGYLHSYTYAIHIPKAALEKGDQPHAHIMYSERSLDGIQRDPDQYFKRYNSKNPEKGGCRKDSAGTKERLLATRKHWADIQNQHLEKHGHSARVDHRSLKEQGIDRRAELHFGPVQVKALLDVEVKALMAHRAAEADFEIGQSELPKIYITSHLNEAIKEHDDNTRTTAFDTIASNVRAADKASRATDGVSAVAVEHNVGITDNLKAAGGNLGRAGEGARRRVVERRYGRVVEAVRGQFERVGGVVRKVADRFGNVVRTVATAAHQVAQQIRSELERNRAEKKGANAATLPTAAPTVPAKAMARVDQVNELVGFLELLRSERRHVTEKGRLLETKMHQVPEQKRALGASLKTRIEGMKVPGMLASKATKQQFDQDLSSLRKQGQEAIDAEHAAKAALVEAKKMQEDPQPFVLAKIRSERPGLVERMQPLTKNAELVKQAELVKEPQRPSIASAIPSMRAPRPDEPTR